MENSTWATFSPSQHAHGLEDLERTCLYSNGFRLLRRLRQRIDDSAVDAASDQLDGGGEADGAGSGGEHLRLRGSSPRADYAAPMSIDAP